MTDRLPAPPRDHGGNLDAAMARWGGAREAWIDLSTGINPCPYPVPPISSDAWAALPRADALARLAGTAAAAYGARSPTLCVPLAGAQGAIQAVPFLRPQGRAAILGPTYNEHAAALRLAGWNVAEVGTVGALAGTDLAVVVNPNNPGGERHAPAEILSLAQRVGLLVMDESFADPCPGLSIVPRLGEVADRALVLRSFGKFYGLAGLRLGFAVAGPGLAGRMAALAGPWPVSGPAIEIACRALADRPWQAATRARLEADAARLDRMAEAAGWSLVGGTPLFRTYAAQDAVAAQEALAGHRIWTRIFPYSRRWIRLGLPGSAADWARLEAALDEASAG